VKDFQISKMDGTFLTAWTTTTFSKRSMLYRVIWLEILKGQSSFPGLLLMTSAIVSAWYIYTHHYCLLTYLLAYLLHGTVSFLRS
jgi:hypothetical protein